MIAKLYINNKMYDILSKGDNNTVIALSKLQVAKVFDLGSTQIKEEFKLLQIANKINNLLVKVDSCQFSEDYKYELLIMERLRVEEYRCFSYKEKQEMLYQFKTELQQLHNLGFVHGDIKRPEIIRNGKHWDNIVCTQEGIRLIDVGCASTLDNCLFSSKVKKDLEYFNEFSKLFLNS